MQYRSLYVPSPDEGVVLHVREWGSGSRTCVLIHGFGQGAYAWSEVTPFLVPRYRTLAIDLRGHGDSSWDPAARYRAHDHAADVLRIIDHLGIDRFVLIGHSLGANVAIRVAAAHRGRVRRIVLVDFGLDPCPTAMAQVRSDFKASLRPYDSVEAYAAWLAERRPLTTPGRLQLYAGEALRPQGDGTFRLKCDPALADTRGEPAERDLLQDALKAISCPVLLTRGVASAVLNRAAAERTMHVLRHCTLSTIGAAGHAVMTDNPEEFAAAIRPFLRAENHHDPDGLSAEQNRGHDGGLTLG
jgi:pimeloyl-ACP methyl ester carboxylesterase